MAEICTHTPDSHSTSMHLHIVHTVAIIKLDMVAI